MAVLFLIAAFAGAFACTLRSLGLGFVAVFAVGYFNGVIRANYLSAFTTFMFDAALFGLFLGFAVGRPREASGIWTTPGGRWTVALIAWPALLVLVPVNDIFVQLVAFRATVWFLPAMLVAGRLRADDLLAIARGLAVLNLAALAGGIYIYGNGIESVYPDNAVTQIIYHSKDVGGTEFYRIPSTFLSAHAYGGTMLFSLPFLLARLFGRGTGAPDRALMACGTVAAGGGILLCGARQPAVMLVPSALIFWASTRFHLRVGLVAAVLGAAMIFFANTDERLQRMTTLEDTDSVSDRVGQSANESFFELMAQYPGGAGMGSSFGTSIPYFIADPPQGIGLENEYCRILIDQGLIGLGLWLAFLVWFLHRPPRLRLQTPWGFGAMMMYALIATNWATAIIGSGTLSSIPCSVMLLAQMGILLRLRTDGSAPGP